VFGICYFFLDEPMSHLLPDFIRYLRNG
jgi:hypothetical protein